MAVGLLTGLALVERWLRSMPGVGPELQAF